MIRELGRISFELDKTISVEWMTKRLAFLAYELQTFVGPEESEHDRLSVLNEFFFKQKKFRSIGDVAHLTDRSDAFRMSRVLGERAGASCVLALIYAYLAEKIGISLEFVDLKPASFLKWTSLENDACRPCYIDITRAGSILSNADLIETLQTRFKKLSISHATVLEPYAFESYLCDYLQDLKTVIAGSADPEILLFIQNTLISYQPSNLYLLGERAVLHRRIGNFKSALADLKRYFAFHERESSPPEFSLLYEELVILLERNK